MTFVTTIALFTFSVWGALTLAAHHAPGPLSAINILAAILVHDAYFYWSHRALHIPQLWRLHRLHHTKRDTQAIDSLRMSPGEALIEAAFFPLAAFALRPGELLLTFCFVMSANTLAHMTATTRRTWPRWLTVVFHSPAHHLMHHYHPQANFGAYLRLWDCLCGTTHKHNPQTQTAQPANKSAARGGPFG